MGEETGFVLDWYDGPLSIFSFQDGEVWFFRILREEFRHKNYFQAWACEKTTKEKLTNYLSGKTDFRTFCKEFSEHYVLALLGDRQKLYKTGMVEDYLPQGDDHYGTLTYIELVYWSINTREKPPKIAELAEYTDFFIDKQNAYLFVNQNSKKICGFYKGGSTFYTLTVKDETTQFVYDFILNSKLVKAKVEALLTDKSPKIRNVGKTLLELR